MIFSSNKTSNIIVYNSITNTLNDEKFDNVKPFSFIEFLNYSKSLDRNIIEYADYQIYLKKWNEVTVVKYNDINVVVREEFIQFLKTIALNYTTAAEKRFISNIDFNSTQDLEIAAPFFAEKIKQVLLYFAEKRDTFQINFELSKNKGSISGVNNYLKTTIIETIFGNDLSPPIATTQPLSTVSNNLSIEVDTGYDTYNNYFDLDPFSPPSFYGASGERAEYFTSNTNPVDKNIFLNYDQAIIDLINSERVVLQELQALVVTVDTPDLNLLQDYDFINYNERTRQNLKLILNAELTKKFTGTDFYYLSTNTNGEILSGMLFEATSPFANILNLHYPSTLTVPQSSTKYVREVGLFFKPTTFSLLELQTPFSYVVNSALSSNYVYVFPDPNSYGNISGVSKKDFETPFTFVQNGKLIQKNISSNNALGNSYVTDNDFTFESYHSKEQNSTKSIFDQLYNYGIITNYVSDIFGNIYTGFKLQNSDYVKNFHDNVTNNVSPFGLSSFTQLPYLSSIKELLSSGSFANTQTLAEPSTTGTSRYSIYKTRNSPGNFLVYNIFNNTIAPLSSEVSSIFLKYPNQLNELQNALYSFEVFGDTFVATTSGHVIIDKLSYENGVFSKSIDTPLTLSSQTNNKCSNVFQVGDNLYIAKVSVTTNPVTSGYNSRDYIVSLYSYSLATSKITNYSFNTTQDNTLSYALFTLLFATNLNLIYNKKQEMFNLVISYKDLNNMLFLNSIFYRIANNVVNKMYSKTFYPLNNNFTLNFYSNENVGSNLQYYTLLTTPTIDNTNGTITF